jgi:two-component system, cell cycle response regulator DivK
MSHILIIDDERTNLAVMEKLLSLAGYTYTSVSDALKVESILQQRETMDLVLLDLDIPDLNGYELFQLVRQYMPSTPVVACTVHTSELNAARQFGFDGFLSKPLNMDVFGGLIRRILNGEAIWQSY